MVLIILMVSEINILIPLPLKNVKVLKRGFFDLGF